MSSVLAPSCTIGLIQLLNNSKLTERAIFLIVPIGNQTCHITIEVLKLLFIIIIFLFSASTQTTLTIPIKFDLEKVLGKLYCCVQE